MFKSRVGAILMVGYPIISIIITLLHVFGASGDVRNGGIRIVIALILLPVSVKAVDATCKYHKPIQLI